MTEDQINIAIAEHCGWEWHNSPGLGCYVSPDKQSTARSWLDLPSYTTDLNAIAQAEATLPKDETHLRRWSDVLMQVIEDSDPEVAIRFYNSRVGLRYYTARATARQRAEAFLRTIRKWRD